MEHRLPLIIEGGLRERRASDGSIRLAPHHGKHATLDFWWAKGRGRSALTKEEGKPKGTALTVQRQQHSTAGAHL